MKRKENLSPAPKESVSFSGDVVSRVAVYIFNTNFWDDDRENGQTRQGGIETIKREENAHLVPYRP